MKLRGLISDLISDVYAFSGRSFTQLSEISDQPLATSATNLAAQKRQGQILLYSLLVHNRYNWITLRFAQLY
jgi:hypothetical protein